VNQVVAPSARAGATVYTHQSVVALAVAAVSRPMPRPQADPPLWRHSTPARFDGTAARPASIEARLSSRRGAVVQPRGELKPGGSLCRSLQMFGG
jgi:hypothetical protein